MNPSTCKPEHSAIEGPYFRVGGEGAHLPSVSQLPAVMASRVMRMTRLNHSRNQRLEHRLSALGSRGGAARATRQPFDIEGVLSNQGAIVFLSGDLTGEALSELLFLLEGLSRYQAAELTIDLTDATLINRPALLAIRRLEEVVDRLVVRPPAAMSERACRDVTASIQRDSELPEVV
jgi:hypothetical protein